MIDEGLKKARTRSAYLRAIRSALQERLYMECDMEKERKVQDLIGKNSALLPGSPMSFMYKGNMYYHWTASAEKGANREIHPSLLADIKKTLECTDFDEEAERQKTVNYVSNVLVDAGCMDDMYALIPSRLHKVVDAIDSQLFNIAPPMDKDKIQKIREANRIGLIAFERLSLLELLQA